MQYVGRVSLMWRPQETHPVKETKEPLSWCKKIIGGRKKVVTCSVKPFRHHKYSNIFISTLMLNEFGIASRSRSGLVFRYVAAGVFSKCIMDSSDCCLDPVVYTRVATLAHWIREKAPGVRSSEGCPMKPVRGKICKFKP